MDARELLQQEFEHLHQCVRDDLAEVDESWLWWQPAPGLSHIGFLYWHLVRDEDTILGRLAGGPETWQSGGWHERLGMDAKAQGTGLDPALLPSFRYDLPTFSAYRDEAWAASSRRLASLDMGTLERPAWPGASPRDSKRPCLALLQPRGRRQRPSCSMIP